MKLSSSTTEVGMLTKTVEVKEDDIGQYIELGDDMMDELGWKAGDTISWKDNKNGTWSIMKKESNIFELEQSIMRCWSLVEDLNTVYNSEELYKDENKMQNALLGLSTLADLKFNECWRLFEEHCQEYWSLKKQDES